MKALVQRVSKASVSIGGEVTGKIQRGLVVLAGIARDDTEEDVSYLADKVANLRIFPDSEGKFNLSLLDIMGEVLVVSQFTLLADASRGRRPSFTDAAPPEHAERLFNLFVQKVAATGLRAATGRFREHMLVEIHNDGPVTLMLDSTGR
ncbi:MAG: D-aminoacyl-tRNA deacylase [Chloroflexota bacterium]